MDDKGVLVTHNGCKVDEEICAKYDFSPVQWQKFRNLEKRQKEFHIWIGNNKKLSEVERQALMARSLADVDNWAALADSSHTQLSEQYRKGFRRWVKKGQDFSSFIDDISPILDVARGLDPSIAFAVGTICGLFAIVGRKGAAEEQAIKIVEGIQDRLPGLAVYQNIYRNDEELEVDLQKKIVLVYIAFIELSMVVTKYCLKSSMRRLGTSFFATISFTQLNDDLNNQLAAVKNRCEELQSLRIAELKKINDKLLASQEKLAADNQELLHKLELMELDRTSQHLTQIQKLFGLGEWSPRTHRSDLEDYLMNIDAEREYETVYEQMRTGSIQRYRKSPNFVEWELPGQSAVLMLQAYNHDAIHAKRHCWVSPLALDVHKRLSTTGSAPHAAYAFDPLRPNNSIFDAIPVALLQLIEQARAKLLSQTEQREDLVAAIKDYIGIKMPPNDPDIIDDEKAEALIKVARHVIRLFESTTTVYLILDRVDQCMARDHYFLIQVIKAMIREASCIVKVLIISNGSSWDGSPRDFKKFTVCINDKLRQEYLTSFGGGY